MAQLGDLPPELILAIFSHLRLGLPMHDLFVWTGDIDEQGRITGVKWNDLLNFSLLNRHFRQIVSDKLYTQIRIQGKLPITRLVSLLRPRPKTPESHILKRSFLAKIRPLII
ncbi:hypothetical protein COL26b_011839 [Colletotrichum chrysophilum]|uniref:uncharacterized protein n=1 Tax=Colletotrichum chrysophilum TaxID=1836956 RepID=UPI0022FFD1B5|nr:uncharacterized protein COL26b_011839 [Colletotrichum chrysophilum]KAJ0366000.1 hypothetical protein COL26b_011839 [Colletotrichum chrysophilum]